LIIAIGIFDISITIVFFGGAMLTLRLREDRSEEVTYTSPNLPIHAITERLSNYLAYTADCHWHQELEFIIVREGEMIFHVNNRIFPLAPGDGIFVNAGQFHFGGPAERGAVECEFLCLQLHPSLLRADPYIETRFVNPLLYDTRRDALFFPAASRDGASPKDWRGEAAAKITALAEVCMRSPDDSALEIQSRFYELWSLLFANTIAVSGPGEAGVSRETAALKQMLSFIQAHYHEKIGLDDIAKAGGVCRSTCCLLFKHVLRETAFEYLIHFRLRRSLSLLADEGLPLTEVAAASGFSGASYYGELFKRETGVSPGEYRRKLRAADRVSLPRF
jgi:AraC-like DNA-binding protein/mannose-6-phosphate isomerase-like protein (cupin superfamily)